MNLVPYIKASYPLIYICTPEEDRAEVNVIKTAQDCKKALKIWSHTTGFITPGEDEGDGTEDPIDALAMVLTSDMPCLYVFRDLHPFFTAPKVKRLVRDIAKRFKQIGSSLIIISAVKDIPPEIERDVTVMEFDLPRRDEIEKIFDKLYNGSKKKIDQHTEIDSNERERIIQSALGLTTNEAESAFAKAIVEKVSDGLEDPISKLVMKEKAETVKKSGILEYFEAKQTANDIGGLDNLKTWLNIRNEAFTKEAREFGLPMPRGILLVGIPGCGKSLAAKAASNILNVPLLKFDVGRVFGGLVGQSEENMRKVIQTAEAVGASCVWVDELEKAFAGMGGGGSTDGGTSQRVFGTFITWMQEKTAPCFIIATANNIDHLPAELLRKGRFDEIFYVGLPTEDEREAILKIHIGRYGRDASNLDLQQCVMYSEDFSGAELEEAVISALYYAFHHKTDLKEEYILNAIRTTNPLARSRATQLETMKKWAESNAVNASVAKKKNKKSAGRQLEI